MKTVFALLLCLFFLFLTSCGSGSTDDLSSTSETVTSQIEESTTRKDILSANDSYGDVKKTDRFPVTDRSVLYRSEDSCRLESVAVRAAVDMIRETLAYPDSLEVKSISIENCADDGTNVFYSVFINSTSLVGSGERLRHVYYYDVGVLKSDEKAFDASNDIENVLQAYSIFRLQADRDAVITFSANETNAFEKAVCQIVSTRFKNAESAKVISAKQRVHESDASKSVWDILCEGDNDYGMYIPDVYTVYIRLENGNIVEIDPDE